MDSSIQPLNNSGSGFKNIYLFTEKPSKKIFLDNFFQQQQLHGPLFILAVVYSSPATITLFQVPLVSNYLSSTFTYVVSQVLVLIFP